jgi:hypothetical protein
MKANLLSKRAIASALGGVALAGIAVTGANAATSAAAPSPASHMQTVRATPDAITPHAVGWSTRACFFGIKGITRLAINAPVSAAQPVVASATELDSFGFEFIGLATVTVDTVAVTNGVINTVVDANWGSPINVCVHYIA